MTVILICLWWVSQSLGVLKYFVRRKLWACQALHCSKWLDILGIQSEANGDLHKFTDMGFGGGGMGVVTSLCLSHHSWREWVEKIFSPSLITLEFMDIQ